MLNRLKAQNEDSTLGIENNNRKITEHEHTIKSLYRQIEKLQETCDWLDLTNEQLATQRRDNEARIGNIEEQQRVNSSERDT